MNGSVARSNETRELDRDPPLVPLERHEAAGDARACDAGDRDPSGMADRVTDRVTDRMADRVTDRMADRVADRMADRVTERGSDQRATDRGAATDRTDAEAPLFSRKETTQLRDRWESVQAGFVDEPRRAVEEADGLVRQVMDRLTDGFAHQRERLEREWDARDETSTEDLRVALRHYRSFFDRLLRL